MVAGGDKAGVFWVLDATTGVILNNAGAGLDLFGGQRPGPGLRGGFNLDSGFMTRGDTVRHFAVLADFSVALQNVVETFPGGVCAAFGHARLLPMWVASRFSPETAPQWSAHPARRVRSCSRPSVMAQRLRRYPDKRAAPMAERASARSGVNGEGRSKPGALSAGRGHRSST